MTARFKNVIIPWLFDHEGRELENDKDDPGGNYQIWRGSTLSPNVDIKNLTEAQAEVIYWNEWLRDGCDHLPSPLDWIFFDSCVNCGMGRAQVS
jgi:lysozyme family protein